ncbi:hypothetical protein Sme01_11880 [Sphaerisporangium melleum]|uniref:Metalloprotease n=1 Tax=Sphaerisporangium melleum TaxID=321316 RepID=A0A917VRL7_9ACTN|nr:hypothetical protein GCM10007964_56900 [Sphaerisporangium melleum]GII68712.1 hypothetical protein Sme01_11880 [Sphaerisporangium melleum]
MDNLLYALTPGRVTCRPPEIRTGDWKSMRRYLTTVSACLDRVWTRHFQRARVYYRPPERRFVRQRVRDRECGLMPSKGADGTYCDATRTYYVIVAGEDLVPWAEAIMAELVAHEYAHHVQNMSYISDYYQEAYDVARGRAREDLLSRRMELQAECFAGVALHAMRAAVPPWHRFREQYTGTLDAAWVRDHGRLATQLRWLERGYRTGRPGTCDTWSPAVRQVT